MKWIINSDIDNTLIYSYKHDIGNDKICVEVYQGREISYMTRRSHELLEKLCERQDGWFVPTTTRTIEQYQRIQFGIRSIPRYALVCNGGVLLDGGISDPDWYRQSLQRIKESQDELEKARVLLETDPNRSMEVRFIEQLFLFTKSSDPELSTARLKEQLDPQKVDIMQNGAKVYVVPVKLNKGAAVKRLKEYLGGGMICSAGDSEFDLPMLVMSDAAFFPEHLRRDLCMMGRLARRKTGRQIVEKSQVLFGICEEELFSEGWLGRISNCYVNQLL